MGPEEQGDVTLKARHVPRGFDEDDFAGVTLMSTRLLSCAIDRKHEQYTVFTAGVNMAFINANEQE